MTQIALWIASLFSLFAGASYFYRPSNKASQLIGAATIAISGIALVLLFNSKDGFDFLTIGSLIAVIGSLLLWFSNRNKDLSLLLTFAFPLSALMLILNAIEPWHLRSLHSQSIGTSIHILIAAVAYSLFTAACGISILLALQEYQLKHHHLRQLLRVPPLQVLEDLMFEFIWAAFILLTITIVTGVYFIDDIFAQKLVHKTAFTIASWCVFAGLLAGHHFIGWRGQHAVKLTLGGFILLMLGYFGSSIVLQFLAR